jgi:hypothetical protein
VGFAGFAQGASGLRTPFEELVTQLVTGRGGKARRLSHPSIDNLEAERREQH